MGVATTPVTRPGRDGGPSPHTHTRLSWGHFTLMTFHLVEVRGCEKLRWRADNPELGGLHCPPFKRAAE